MNGQKYTFHKINVDAQVRALKPNECRNILNGIAVAPSAGDIGDCLNFFGNSEVANADLPAGTNTVIGAFEDVVGQRVFYFIHNSNNDHTIYQYEPVAGTITRVLRTSLLAFQVDKAITGVDIYGDKLFFTDGETEIKKINVALAIAGATYTPTLDELTFIKRPPQLVLTLALFVDTSFDNNYIKERNFQFYYRYIYEDNEASVFSQISASITGVTTSAFNQIQVTIPAAEVIPVTVKQIDYAVRVNETNEFFIYKRDFPVAGVLASNTHFFYNDVYNEGVPDNESFKWNESVPLTSKALKIHKNRLFFLNNKEGYAYPAAPLEFTATPSTVVGAAVGDPLYKSFASYQFGLMFFDYAGRHAGVHAGPRVTILDEAYLGDYYEVTADLTAIALGDIPTWATHYSVVRTNANIPFFIHFVSSDIFYYVKAEDGTITYNKTYSASNTGIALDIGGLPKREIGYTFQAGDRVRLYDAAIPDNPLDLEIKEQSGKLLFLPLVDLGVLSAGAANPITFMIYTPAESGVDLFYEVGERYVIDDAGTGTRALSDTSIVVPGDITYVQRVQYVLTGYSPTDPYGNTTTAQPDGPFEAMNAFDKTFNQWIHRTGRSIALSQIGSLEMLKTDYIRFTQPFIRNSALDLFNVCEALDEYALRIGNGIGQTLKSAGDVLVATHQNENVSIYVGDGFVSTTDGSQFLAKTDNVIGDERPNLGGHGTMHPLSVVEKGGRVYYYNVLKGAIIRRSNDGLTIISDYGISTIIAEMSRAFFPYKDDPTSVRVVGGWDPVYHCYVLSFDDTVANGGTYKRTLYFHEGSNSWVARPSLNAIMYSNAANFLLAFSTAGGLWKQVAGSYNNFFGVQYTRQVDIEIAPQESLEKIWTAIEVDIDSIYTTDASNEIIVTLLAPNGHTTRINYLDFQLQSSAYRSAFFRMLTDHAFDGEADPETASKYGSPHAVRGLSAYITIVGNGEGRNPMKSITVFYEPSLLSYP